MELCDKHHKLFVQAIEDRGLVCKKPEEVMRTPDFIIGAITGNIHPGNFDPFISGAFAIMTAFVGTGGSVEVSCPLCEIDKEQKGLAENWINGCANDQYLKAKELGIIPKALN